MQLCWLLLLFFLLTPDKRTASASQLRLEPLFLNGTVIDALVLLAVSLSVTNPALPAAAHTCRLPCPSTRASCCRRRLPGWPCMHHPLRSCSWGQQVAVAANASVDVMTVMMRTARGMTMMRQQAAVMRKVRWLADTL